MEGQNIGWDKQYIADIGGRHSFENRPPLVIRKTGIDPIHQHQRGRRIGLNFSPIAMQDVKPNNLVAFHETLCKRAIEPGL